LNPQSFSKHRSPWAQATFLDESWVSFISPTSGLLSTMFFNSWRCSKAWWWFPLQEGLTQIELKAQ